MVILPDVGVLLGSFIGNSCPLQFSFSKWEGDTERVGESVIILDGYEAESKYQAFKIISYFLKENQKSLFVPCSFLSLLSHLQNDPFCLDPCFVIQI